MHDYTSSNKIKENKYKILRMSLLLGSDDNREETIRNFEVSAREIDEMNDEIYLKNLESKFYDTLKLEEEEKKLVDLVDYIGGRVEQRISLLTDFANVAGYDLVDLPPIKYYDRLDDYKERLKNIQEYLSNTEEINKLNKEVEASNLKLTSAYANKAASEDNNLRSEETLLKRFNGIIKDVEELNDVNGDNIDAILNKYIGKTEESKKSLEIFTKSFMTLTNAGISYDEEKEYRSYVENAKDVYYSDKEIEYLLRLYKLLLKEEKDYSSLIVKRDNINNILTERMKLKRDLHINKNDILESLYELLDNQYDDIQRQKNNIDNIDLLTTEISQKKDRIVELEQDNQKVEILALLREYGIIDTYEEEINTVEDNVNNMEDFVPEVEKDNGVEVSSESNDVNSDIFDMKLSDINENSNEDELAEDKEDSVEVSDVSSEKNEELVEKEVTIDNSTEEVSDNQVVNVEVANNIDIDLVQSKANKVMKRVGEMLGIKVEDTKIVNVSSDNVEDASKEEVIPEEKNDLPENPLFSNNIEENSNVDSSNEEEDNFWFSSDNPDALNELPDLEVPPTDNFFTNNNIGDLNFPDLNVNFSGNDTEVK